MKKNSRPQSPHRSTHRWPDESTAPTNAAHNHHDESTAPTNVAHNHPDEPEKKVEEPLTKLWWIDLEMTGLDVRKEVIIEVALIITDIQLKPLDRYHSVVRQDPQHIENMDDWNTRHHAMSGLTKQIPHGRAAYKVEDDLLILAREHSRDEKIVLAGNSIAQDRLFICKYFTRFAPKLHHRMLDVSSLKIVFRHLLGHEYEKPASHHRAMDDVQASINELKEYLKYIRVPSDAK